jgi:hypothetical protein
LPYEHWANAIFLKHCSGLQGMHLNLESTIKTVFDSYSCGKENFGFDRDFIIEVLNSCPSNSCRMNRSQQQQQQQQVYESQQHQQQQQQQQQSNPNFGHPPPQISMNMEYGISPTRSPFPSPMQPPIDHSKMNRPLTNQQITQQLLQQQQNIRMNQQSIENLEKQRVMQQLDKKHYETVAAIVQANNNLGLPNQINPPAMMPQVHNKPITDYSRRRESYDGIETYSAASYATSNRELLHNNWIMPNIQPISIEQRNDGSIAGQEKIVRAFAELMKNMARMKAFIKPSMVVS